MLSCPTLLGSWHCVQRQSKRGRYQKHSSAKGEERRPLLIKKRALKGEPKVETGGMFGMNKLPLAFVSVTLTNRVLGWRERDTYLWCIMKSKSWKWTCSLRFKGLIVNSNYLPLTKHESRRCQTVSFLSTGLDGVAVIFRSHFMKASIRAVIRCLITDWDAHGLMAWLTGFLIPDIQSVSLLLSWCNQFKRQFGCLKICLEVYCKGHWEYWLKLQPSSDLLVWNGITRNVGE